LRLPLLEEGTPHLEEAMGLPFDVADQPQIPAAEFPERRARAAARARELGYRGLIVWSRGGATYDNFGDVLYLTNHYGPFPWINDKPPLWSGRSHSAVIVTADGESELCVDIPDWRTDLVSADAVHVDRNLYRGVAESAARHGFGEGEVGVVGLEAMPASAYRYLANELSGADLRDADDLVMGLRMEKSDAEIEMLRYSAKVGAAITRAMLEQVEIGNDDGDLAAAAFSLGARIPGVAQWDVPLASGACSGHFQYARLPSWDAATPYRAGDLVHPDNYGYVNGYIYDIVRTRVVGDRPEDWQKEIIEGAAGCVRAVIGAMKPGITAGELFDVGKAFLLSNSFTDEVAFNTSFPCFGHGDGHAFDDPWLARNTPDENVPVVAGSVWSIEIQVGRNGRAAGFEDMVVVNRDGRVEILTEDLPIRWGW
jgi:Xaa-Pro aminopeptidase